MQTNNILGFACLVLGVTLLGAAYQSVASPMVDFQASMMGTYSDETLRYFVTGIVITLGGGIVALSGRYR